jgi:predicted ArsR family transcriptional regulator
MSAVTETSDDGLLDLLRKRGGMSVSELATATHVTPTAVRQRLSRLMRLELIAREVSKAGRGRPSHRYLLTEKGKQHSGNNFGDLAIALWQEVRSISDPEVRRGLLSRLAKQMSTMYASRVTGVTTGERMESVRNLFAERNVPLEVGAADELPVLTALACPYPQLAEQDRGICALEKMLFSELVGSNLRLSECRLDGGNCCTFETN